jgi:hypothetical protein
MATRQHACLAGRTAFITVCAIPLLGLMGCQNEEEIQHYRVDRAESVSREFAPKGQSKVRMLGAMIPHGDRVWFFKLRGPVSLVGKYKEEFTHFIRSLRFHDEGEKPITWTVPKDWKEEPGRGMRYATFRLGPEEATQELTVIPLGREAGSVLANVNRWREELGLDKVSAADLDKVTTTIKVHGNSATLVDLKGPGARANPMSAPFADLKGLPGTAPPSLNYRTPKTWQKSVDPGAGRLAAFQVSEGDEVAVVGISSFPGRTGGLALNVNRWRAQVGLEEASAEEMGKEVREMEVDGERAYYVNLAGPKGEPGRKRLLGVMVLKDDHSWFFTMKGPAGLVSKQQSTFEAFIKSVRFEAGRGEDHE